MKNEDKSKEHNTAYNDQIVDFRKCFYCFRDKKIVLYGIGRYTATILNALSKEFCFVGLMDKDPEKIGATLHGFEIISLNEAERRADIIIICTTRTYWRIIFSRIKSTKLPVYYLNGDLAVDNETDDYSNNPYWNLNEEKIYLMSKEYDVVSFDIFDTLITRRVLSPTDIFFLLEKRANEAGIYGDIERIRVEINSVSNDEYLSINEIYNEMASRLGLSINEKHTLMNIELSLERELCVPRKEMIELCNRIAREMTVCLVSDMYLSSEFIMDILFNFGLDKTVTCWISAEKKANKRIGNIWDKFKKRYPSHRVLHVGDNEETDKLTPQKHGIDTLQIYSPLKMWEESSMKVFLGEVNNPTKSIFAGLIASLVFSNPFGLSATKGKVTIIDNHLAGYIIFGGIVYSFLNWMTEKCEELKIDRLLFMARDCYFLQKDYEFMWSKINREKERSVPHNDYLPISRRLVIVSSGEDNYESLLSYPYVGSYLDYVQIRFNMDIPLDGHENEQILLPMDKEKISAWLKPYEKTIRVHINKEAEHYKEYLSTLKIKEDDAVVDLWYNGNNQYYLSKSLNMSLTGFYFAANLNPDNKCAENNKLISCFQRAEDLSAKNCNIRRMDSFVESFLTAPYGMILAVDKNGTYECAPKMKNQTHWINRIEMNDGIQEFIEDWIEICGSNTRLDPFYMDSFFGLFNDRKVDLNEEMKAVFFSDNIFVKRQELEVFS